nr:SpoIID/LytB domain-containing protein [Patulibacter sp. SYSU D01012]
MAAHGASAREILAHYYTGTSISRLRDGRRVRVALQWGRDATTVSGAATIGGARVDPARAYRIVRHGSGVRVLPADGSRPVGTAKGGVQVRPAAGTVRVAGGAADGVVDGAFRGRVDVLPDGAGVVVVNDLDLEDYLRGVVTKESPADWPAAALQAQAIAARTYAVTNAVGGRSFDQWPDVRSQVYAGIAGETAAGDRAVRATRGQVVTIDRKPVITYFFSTSGGRTEDARNVFPDPTPRSWLRSVPDPYEADAPLHRWTRTFSLASASARLDGVGRIRAVQVLRRGDSPRIVRARVTGTAGRRTVDGGTLQTAFDLPDRPSAVVVVSISACRRATPGPTPATAAPSAADVAADDPAAGALALAERGARDVAAALDRARRASAAPADGCRLVGALRPAPAATADVQERRASGWRTVRRVRLDGDGGFAVTVPRGGTWRLRAGGVATPAVAARR